METNFCDSCQREKESIYKVSGIAMCSDCITLYVANKEKAPVIEEVVDGEYKITILKNRGEYCWILEVAGEFNDGAGCYDNKEDALSDAFLNKKMLESVR